MADGRGSSEAPEGQAPYIVVMGAARQGESLCTLGHQTPRVALPARRLRRGTCGITRANIHYAIRAPCRKDGAMKRAARNKSGPWRTIQPREPLGEQRNPPDTH